MADESGVAGSGKSEVPPRRSPSGSDTAETHSAGPEPEGRKAGVLDVRDRYFIRLDLPANEPSPLLKAALARAHELRKFEIENYWKRSSYFWGFQLVAFGALALTAKDGRFHPPIVLIVAVLGALAALTGILTARGSKFWQANWESHVDFLEPKVEGLLHATALMDDNMSYSVSRVNERFLELLFLGWLIAFISATAALILPELMTLGRTEANVLQIGISAVALVAGVFRLLRGQKSDLRGRAYNRHTMAEWVPLLHPK